MNRRQLLKALAAGGVMTAAGLWMPGQKLISIPSGKVFVLTGSEILVKQQRAHDEFSIGYSANSQWFFNERWVTIDQLRQIYPHA